MTLPSYAEFRGPVPTEPEWRRLSHRVIWVDLVVGVLSLAPGVLGLWLAPSSGALWPLLAVTLVGVGGAVADTVRWATTTYRVTDTEVQRRSGVLVRRSRAVRQERIRSVDTYAKLRHRLAGMRVVTVGAGQQTSSREAAFTLDALDRAGAERLREEILGIAADAAPVRSRATTPTPSPAPGADAATTPTDPSGPDATAPHEVGTEETAHTEQTADAQEPTDAGVQVLERFELRWVLYNVFTLWAYLMAAGMLWLGHWLLSTVGIDLFGAVTGLVDDLGLGWVGVTVLAVVVGGALGVVALGIQFTLSHWDFELARVTSGKGTTFLRTRRGLFSTREVNRDEARVRGITIDEPLAWRWMGMADTHVLTTGLSLGAGEEATALVPRGPVSVARRVAGHVVGDAYAAAATLARHPRAALRRRLFWATGMTAAGIALVVVPIWLGPLPAWALWVALGAWPVALAGAVAAYRALGHAIHGDHLITRSGLVNRSTAVLRRDAVSTIAVRQSLLQRRLGLGTVTAMTAAGWGAYEAPDVEIDEAFAFASAAAPGIIDPFLEPRRD